MVDRHEHPGPRVSLVTSSGGPRELGEAARLAEAAGFESVWATEFYDRSATVALAAMAHATTTIELGSAIAYAFGRTPVVLAAEARDLDELSDGRLTLGLGTGTRRMQREWHGLDGEHPASRMEELVPLLRQIWRLHEGPLDHEGRFYRMRVTPTAMVAAPLRTAIPIYMAGVNAAHDRSRWGGRRRAGRAPAVHAEIRARGRAPGARKRRAARWPRPGADRGLPHLLGRARTARRPARTRPRSSPSTPP